MTTKFIRQCKFNLTTDEVYAFHTMADVLNEMSEAIRPLTDDSEENLNFYRWCRECSTNLGLIWKSDMIEVDVG